MAKKLTAKEKRAHKLASNNRYYKANSEKCIADVRRYQKANPEKVAANRQKPINIEKRHARDSKYRSKHKIEYAMYNALYRAVYSNELAARKRPRNLQRNHKYRADAISHYGGKCACCGETEPKFLTIDHIDGGGGKHKRAAKCHNIGTLLRREGYPPGFQVLCWNCNCGRQLNGGVCPHKQNNRNKPAARRC